MTKARRALLPFDEVPMRRVMMVALCLCALSACADDSADPNPTPGVTTPDDATPDTPVDPPVDQPLDVPDAVADTPLDLPPEEDHPSDTPVDADMPPEQDQPLDTPIDADMPPEEDMPLDADMPPVMVVCGDSVVGPGETCDDGGTDPGDGCSDTCQIEAVAGITAFRIDTLALRDPHVFVNFLACTDATDMPLFGLFAINTELQKALDEDGDMDGLRDLSLVVAFDPLDPQQPTSPTTLHFADCTDAATPACMPGMSAAPVMASAANLSQGVCLAPQPNTTHTYMPPVVSAAASCFSAPIGTLPLSLGGINIVLTDASVGATYAGPNGLTQGLLRGFISEADANAATLPQDLPLIGGQPLSSLLPGGMGACAPHSDKDTHNGVAGWWFYLNFTASQVPWTP